MRLWTSSSAGADLVFVYDHPLHASFLQVNESEMMRLLREQTGIALPAALGVLVVIGLLSSSVFAVSLRLNDTSTASRDAKRALAAADAGLEAAMFRMNVLGVQSIDQCFTTAGRGSRQRERPGDRRNARRRRVRGRAGRPRERLELHVLRHARAPGRRRLRRAARATTRTPDGQVTVTQRCVTSIGQVNGERRRVQARVASYIGTQLFPVGGILAINGIKVKNTAIVNGVLGSNGQIDLGNNSVVDGGIQLGTASTPPPTLGNGSTLGGPGHLPLGGRRRVRARAGRHGQHRDRQRQRPNHERPGLGQQRHLHEHRSRAKEARRSATTAR